MLHTQGVVAFTALEPTEILRDKPGAYYSIVEIPPHLLAEGEYAIGVSIFTSAAAKQRFVLVKDTLVCQIYDPMVGVSREG